MKNELTKTEQTLLDEIEQGGVEMIIKHNVVWGYLDGKRNGCKTFDERIEQLSKQK